MHLRLFRSSFLAKRYDKKEAAKTVKKILQNQKIYDTLYTKLVAFLVRGKSLTFDKPNRIGRM